MKIRKLNGRKEILATVIIGIVLGFCVWPITMIPFVAWQAIGIVIWILALSSGACSIFGLFVPTVHYFGKWIHWAFIYMLFADKNEPKFPPVWDLNDSWEKFYPFLAAFMIAVCLIFGTLSLILAGHGLVMLIGLFVFCGLIAACIPSI